MDLKFIGITFAILVVGSVVSIDPTVVAKYKELVITTFDNPYFSNITHEISSSGETLSTRFLLNKPFSNTATVSLTVEFEGMNLYSFEVDLCELIENEFYGKEMVKHGLPADKFPKKCPVEPGAYGLNKYPLPTDKIPPGTPSGDYVIQEHIGEPGEPWFTIDVIIEISHQVPQLPALGLGR